MNIFKFFHINAAEDIIGYQNLQKRINEKSSYLDNAYSCFTSLSKSLKDFLRQIINYNTKFTAIKKSSEDEPVHETCKLVYQKLINDLEQNNNLIDEYMNHFNNLIKIFNEEKNYYENLKKINKDIEEEKIKLSKNKDIYHKVGSEAEKKIKIFVQNNLQNLSNLTPELKTELNNITSSPVKALDNYTSSVNKVNELINKYNYIQSILFNSLPELGNEDGVFFFRLVKLYFQCLENGEKYLNLNKKQMNNSKTVETNSKLKELIEENENKKYLEKKVNLIHYPSSINFNKCKDKKEFDICALTMDTINKHINKDIFKDYNYDKQLKSYEEGKIIKQLFEEKGEISEEASQKFLDTLNDESVHYSVLVILSQLRTNNAFQRTKSLIKCLGKAFNKILENAEKNKLYDFAKNCIILSQTYYYCQENEKDKIYVLEEIKNNKWLKSPQFWRGFIDAMITNEFERLEADTHIPFLASIKTNNMSDDLKSKFNDVIFSQLLAYITNMICFISDKRIIIKISDEFIKKYNYLSNSNLDTLFGIISKDKEEIEKLRKEYDESLEKNLI